MVNYPQTIGQERYYGNVNVNNMSEEKQSFEDYLKKLEELPQPTCNLEDPENRESCSGWSIARLDLPNAPAKVKAA